jgi:hypothetical protein
MPDPLPVSNDLYPYVPLESWLETVKHTGTEKEQANAIYITVSSIMDLLLTLVPHVDPRNQTGKDIAGTGPQADSLERS